MKLLFYNLNTVKETYIDWPDFYFTPEYGLTQEGNGWCWECCYIPLKFLYVYLINNAEIRAIYGYGGMYIYDGVSQAEFEEIRQQFIELKHRDGITNEFIRKNPYLGSFSIPNVDLISDRKTFGVVLGDYDYYWQKCKGDHRNMVRKGCKLGYNFEFKQFILDDIPVFKQIYNSTMNKLNASDDYFYTDFYYEKLIDTKCVYIAKVTVDDRIVGMALFFIYKKYIHYHLSGTDKSSNCTTDFMINKVINWCTDHPQLKLFHLGGGVTAGDSLEKFKSKIATNVYEYKVYKKIYNKCL